jgi:MFS transporter, MHS family, proline/betaine transporter
MIRGRRSAEVTAGVTGLRHEPNRPGVRGHVTASSVDAVTPAERRRARNSVIYGSAGTVVEWFDYGLYLYLVPVMAPLIFPTGDQLTAIIASLGVFAAGSFLRVFGGAFFGSLGDRLGRKKALVLSILMMTAPMALTAFLPTYAAIGILAPVLFTIMRMLQGFSAGGEYSGTVVQLVEQAPASRRGFLASSAVLTSGVGILLASGLVALLTTVLTTEAMADWGWRACYLVGGALGLFALVMRRRMDETVAFEREEAAGDVPRQPLRYALRHLPGPVLLAAFLAGYGGILYYVVLGFGPTILDTYSDLQSDTALWVTTGMTIAYAFVTPAFGALSDRLGRRPVMIGAAVGFLVLSGPLLWWMTHEPVGVVVIAGGVLLVLLMAYGGPVVAAIGEQFPSRARYSALATGYNLGNAVLGGLAPLTAAWLISVFDSPVAPALLLVVASLVALPLLWRLRETRGITLAQMDANDPRAGSRSDGEA